MTFYFVFIEGGSGQNVSIVVFVVALIVELIVVLVLVFVVRDACKYVKDSKGVIYQTRQYVRQLSVGDSYKVAEGGGNKYDRETGSVSIISEVNGNSIRKTNV